MVEFKDRGLQSLTDIKVGDSVASDSVASDSIKVLDGGEAVSERKRAFGGGQNSTLKKAVSEQRRGKSASLVNNFISPSCNQNLTANP